MTWLKAKKTFKSLIHMKSLFPFDFGLFCFDFGFNCAGKLRKDRILITVQ
jgi:hypothetical protein